MPPRTRPLPVIDVSPLEGDSSAAPCIAAIADACREIGAFQIVGHGVAPALTDRLHTQARAFFARPRAERDAVARTGDNSMGYYDRELTKNEPDWKQVFDAGVGREAAPATLADAALPRDHNQWPAGMPAFRDVLLEYMAACERLSFRLLDGLCRGLGLSARTVLPSFDDHTSFLRLNYYPRCADPAPSDAPMQPSQGHLGVNRHTDAGALTIVWQDEVGGLQVYRDGAWQLVEPVAGALVVNLADMLQVWTNDRYRSPLHRVLTRSDRERYSAPFFFNPSNDAVCAPLAALLDDDGPRYRPIRWGEFRRLRSDGDYADVGDEIQIAHYRL